jgi:hypothetical protein
MEWRGGGGGGGGEGARLFERFELFDFRPGQTCRCRSGRPCRAGRDRPASPAARRSHRPRRPARPARPARARSRAPPCGRGAAWLRLCDARARACYVTRGTTADSQRGAPSGRPSHRMHTLPLGTLGRCAWGMSCAVVGNPGPGPHAARAAPGLPRLRETPKEFTPRESVLQRPKKVQFELPRPRGVLVLRLAGRLAGPTGRRVFMDASASTQKLRSAHSADPAILRANAKRQPGSLRIRHAGMATWQF